MVKHSVRESCGHFWPKPTSVRHREKANYDTNYKPKKNELVKVRSLKLELTSLFLPICQTCQQPCVYPYVYPMIMIMGMMIMIMITFWRYPRYIRDNFRTVQFPKESRNTCVDGICSQIKGICNCPTGTMVHDNTMHLHRSHKGPIFELRV